MKKVIEVSIGLGVFMLIDEQDEQLIATKRWVAKRLSGRIEAVANIRKADGTRTQISVQRFLLTPRPGFIVDHRDGNPLNNQRSNLRVCRHSQNLQNQRKSRGRSKYKGVKVYAGNRSTVDAQIAVGGKKIRLGSFATEEAAAKAYDKAARKHFGEFAALNFPNGNERSCLN